MASTYPSAIQTFTNPSGTSLLASGPDHAAMHTTENDTLGSIQTVLGTNAGTAVLKSFALGDQAINIRSGRYVIGSAGGTILDIPDVSPSSNYVQVQNANGTATPTISGVGTATSVNLALSGKSAGSIVFLSPAFGTINASTLGTPTLQSPTLNGTGTLAGSLINNGTINGGVYGTVATSGAFSNGNITGNGTINWSNGDVQFGTLTGNGTLTYSNQKTFQRLTLVLYQDGTGGRTLTLPTSKYPGGAAPTYGTAASAINGLVIIYDGTNNLTQAATTFS